MRRWEGCAQAGKRNAGSVFLWQAGMAYLGDGYRAGAGARMHVESTGWDAIVSSGGSAGRLLLTPLVTFLYNRAG